MRRLPSLSALRAFEAAARHLSFAKAAGELALSPTAVSHQVRALEQSLGRPLFRRHPRPIALTPEGEALAEGARAAFDGLAATWSGLRQPSGARPLVVSATRAFAGSWLIPRLGRASAELGLELQVEASEAVADLHAEGVDVALRYRRAPPQGLQAKALLHDRFIPVARPDVTGPLVRAGELRRHTLIHARWARPDLELPTWAHYLAAVAATDSTAAEVDPGAGLRLSEESQALAAALAGQGIALASEWLVRDPIVEGRLVQVLPYPVAGATLYATWLATSPAAAAIGRFVNWLAAEMGTPPEELAAT